MKIQFNQDLVIQKLKRKTIVFDGSNSQMHTFNSTGALILSLLQKNCSTDQIAQVLIKRYKVSYRKALNDIKNFIEELIDKNIVTGK